MTERPEITYKVVEVAPVTEESLQAALNERTAGGWSFESLHFVMREGSHRPAMAYLFFTRGPVPSRRAEGQPEEAGPQRAEEEAGSARRRAEAKPEQSEAPGGTKAPPVR